MSYPLNRASQLQPIVKRAVLSLYGKKARNTTIHEAQKIPLFKEPKKYWQVDVLFNDGEYTYNVQFEIDIYDGSLTRIHEMHRDPISR
jgi:hypothetical protein